MRRDFTGSMAMAMMFASGLELLLAMPANAVGFCRDPVKCPCTNEDRKEVAKEIEGLKGRLHQLSEANRLLQKQMHDAESKRDAASARIWGAKGSLADFSEDIAKTGGVAEGPIAELGELVGVGADIVKEPESGDTWAHATAAGVKSVAELNEEAAKDAISQSAKKMVASVQSGGDPLKAASTYTDEVTRASASVGGWGALVKAAKVVGGILTLDAIGDSALKLSDDILAWAEAKKEVERLEAERDRLNEQINDLTIQILRLEARCSGSKDKGSEPKDKGKGNTPDKKDGTKDPQDKTSPPKDKENKGQGSPDPGGSSGGSSGGASGGSASSQAIITITIVPSNAEVRTKGTQKYQAVVTGTANQEVAWRVLEGERGGGITSAGLYSAPDHADTYHVTATSIADPSKSATATVQVIQQTQLIVVSDDQAKEAGYKLKELIALTRGVEERRLRSPLFVPLSPFMVEGWRQVPPKLLWEIAKDAKPELYGLRADLKEIVKRSRVIEAALQQKTQ